MHPDSSNTRFNPPIAKIAFFDLDNTLTDIDTDILWSSWRSKRSLKGWVERACVWLLYRAYSAGRLDAERLVAYQRFRVGSMSVDSFRAMAAKFFSEDGEKHIFKEAFDLIRSQREAGARIAILTAQHEILAEPFAAKMNADDLIGMRFENENNKLGAPLKPYCYREGKIYWAKLCAEKYGATLADCAFYSDSANDVPLLQLVGYPVATNPDPALAKIALRRNWKILTFGENKSEIAPKSRLRGIGE